MRRSKKSRSKKPILLAAILVALLAVGAYWLYHSKHSKPAPLAIYKDNTVAPTTTASPSGKSSNPAASPAQGGAIDQNGRVSSPTSPSSQWATSSSGIITLEQPTNGSTIKSGDDLNGTAKVSAVQFRLIDNVRGVVAQGQLNVVNGKFSGILSFESSGTNGRLDVFSLDPNTGTEINEIQIPISIAK